MGGEPQDPHSAPIRAVFLSYASEDAAAALRICTDLRNAGIEVWFDQSELRGGDAWDAAIRRQIKTCALFIPVISDNAHARVEGYFRLEWKLAIDRSHLMAPDQAFLLPVAIDHTPQADERIPERFRELQWSRLPAGQASPAFVSRVRNLLSPQPALGALSAPMKAAGSAPPSPRTHRESILASKWSKPALLASCAAAVLATVAYLVGHGWFSGRIDASQRATSRNAQTTAAPADAFQPPPHSIAVLPFVNMSDDKQQEYFSEGLTEELLNSLARINELQVAARTSSFSFAGKNLDIATVARKLNVAAVLEGSVRRSGHTLRVSAQLINATNGFHVWSQSYDRDVGDVLQLQTEIANAVAGALEVTLLGDVRARIEIGGTRNPAAFDAYLRASQAFSTQHGPADDAKAIETFGDAIRLDPYYALAYTGRARALTAYAGDYATGSAVRESLDRALMDARRALELAPGLAEGHWALARVFEFSLEFRQALVEYEHAASTGSGNARILGEYGRFATYMGKVEPGIAAVHRSVLLDPLSPRSHSLLAQALYFARRHQEATVAATEALRLDPERMPDYAVVGLNRYLLGDLQAAIAVCARKSDEWGILLCQAVTYQRLGNHADAGAARKKLESTLGDASAYQFSEIYAQWGEPARALQWLETAQRRRDPGLSVLKMDPLMDPLRSEPRFQAVLQALQFPR
jgi:TolB-like protein/Tfp pilus assembly protein PilF